MQRRGCFFTHKSEFLSELDLALDVALQLGDGHTHLLHGVAVADGDAVVGGNALGLVAHGVEVHGDAVGGADLVLTAVALADGAGVVVVHHEVLAQLIADLHCLVTQLLAQGQDSALIGSQSRVQMQDGADVLLALAVGQMLLVVGLAQESQRHAVAAQRRLDDVGDVVLVGLAVEVLEALAGGLLMAAQVVVGAVGDAPQLAPIGKREGVLDVGGGAAVEGQLCRLVVTQAQVLLLDAEAQQPVLAIVITS